MCRTVKFQVKNIEIKILSAVPEMSLCRERKRGAPVSLNYLPLRLYTPPSLTFFQCSDASRSQIRVTSLNAKAHSRGQ